MVRLSDLRNAKLRKQHGEGDYDFEFSDEQELFLANRRGVFLADNCPPTVVRKVLDGDAEYDAELWQKSPKWVGRQP